MSRINGVWNLNLLYQFQWYEFGVVLCGGLAFDNLSTCGTPVDMCVYFSWKARLWKNVV